MAQNYTEQLRKDNVRDAIYEDLQNNCEVLRTSWSGNAFPANPKVGQPCYRVDEDKLYYWDGYKWSQKGGGGSAELKTMELAAATSERVSITLEGARCLDKNMMFVFVDKIAQDPSTYSMNDDGTVVNFNPAIPANAAVTLRWFDTDVGTFDTAIFASDAEFAAGELTNRAPNVKQVHSLSDMVASKLSGLEVMDVGFAPLGIDESKNKRRYLNGQVIIQSQFPAFTAAVKARMSTMANAFTTEENWQAEKTNSKLGQCGKFVVDDTAGTIRLPCVVNAQGLVGLSMIGGIKSESLPNVTGTIEWLGPRNTSSLPEGTGAFSTVNLGAVASGGTTSSLGAKVDFNASSSSSTYQDNAPVQQEAIQYPYYIQVATGVEETLPAIREYNINTPFFFGQSMYSDVAPDNASWLASNGQYNARSVYPDYYDWLLEQMNAGVSGFVASTASYTDYDFVINTTDQTFRLPLKNGQEGVFADGVKGNGMTLGLTNGTQNGGTQVGTVFGVVVSAYGTQVGSSNTTDIIPAGRVGITSDPSKSGMIVDKTVPSGWNLYYYVGDTVQDASLINAGAVLGQLATKTNSVEAAEASMPSGRYIKLTLGASDSNYTAPANGFICIAGTTTNNGYYQSDKIQYFTMKIRSGTAGGLTSLWFPVKKGQVFNISYVNIDKHFWFRFIYAEGEE